MRTAFRIDRLSPVQEVLDDLLPPSDGPGGSVLLEGVVAHPGIYLYADGKGGMIRELVPRATLWDASTAETLGRTPVTIEHPSVFVNDSNVQELSHGDVDGELVEGKNGYVKIKMAIRTAEAKDAIANGKRQLSPGYLCWIDDTPGVDPEFGEYDSVQTRREYNHVALCDAARGGAVCAIRVDSEEIEVPIGERDDGYRTTRTEKVKATSTFEDDDGYTTTTTTTVVVNEEQRTSFPGDPAEDEPAPFAALDSAISKLRDAESLTPDMLALTLEEFKVAIMEGLAKSVKTAVTEAVRELRGEITEPPEPEMPETPGMIDPNAPPMPEGGAEGEDMPPAEGEGTPPSDGQPPPAEGGQPPADGPPPSEGSTAPAEENKPQAAGDPGAPTAGAGTPPTQEEDPKKPKVDRQDSTSAVFSDLKGVAGALRIDYTRFDSASDLARAILGVSTPKLNISSDEAAIGAALALSALGATTAPIAYGDATKPVSKERRSIYGSQNQEQ